jgi:hypothetical protein
VEVGKTYQRNELLLFLTVEGYMLHKKMDAGLESLADKRLAVLGTSCRG